MEIHSAPGPPRTQVVLDHGRRSATLEVQPDRDRGAILCADRTQLRIERPPGSVEWWVEAPDRGLRAVVRRCQLVGERFDLHLAGPEDLDLEVVPQGSLLRRRWEVRDPAGRALVEVVQRRWCRPVHDLAVRSGDVPRDLPLLVAWTLALVTCPPPPATGRRRLRMG